MGMANCPTKDSKPGDEHRALDGQAAKGIRPIAHDDGHAVPPPGPQTVRHGVDKRVDAGADVLQVDDQHIQILQHP